MGGLPLYMLTITGRSRAGYLKISKRKVVLIQARIHAGESHSSYLM